jgi:SnoaL-like domain
VTTGFDRARSTEEIRRIILAYPELMDRGDVDGVVAFLTGVRLSHANGFLSSAVPDEDIPMLTADDVRTMYSRGLRDEDGLPRTKHVVTNIDIWFSDDGRGANSRAYCVVLRGAQEPSLQIVMAGRYEDSFEYDGDAWRLRVRRQYADIVGDLTHDHAPQPLTQTPAP